MSKELEALEYLKPFRFEDEKAKEAYDTIEQAITELEELKRDVKRYFELDNQEVFGDGMDDTEAIEFTDLHIKLSKVGKRE